MPGQSEAPPWGLPILIPGTPLNPPISSSPRLPLPNILYLLLSAPLVVLPFSSIPRRTIPAAKPMNPPTAPRSRLDVAAGSRTFTARRPPAGDDIQFWGRSSVGRALAWHARGRRFKPDRLHSPKPRRWRGLCVLAGALWPGRERSSAAARNLMVPGRSSRLYGRSVRLVCTCASTRRDRSRSRLSMLVGRDEGRSSARGRSCSGAPQIVWPPLPPSPRADSGRLAS
jgi:hypothetical protein